MIALGLTLLFMGFMLAYAAVHGEGPWDEVKKAFGG